MKQILVIMAAVVLVGCGEKAATPTPKGKPEVPKTAQAAEAELIADIIDEMAARRNLEKPKGKPEVPGTAQAAEAKLIADIIVEMAVRRSLEKPEGELTKADLVEVTHLGLKKMVLLTRASRKWPSCGSSHGLAWVSTKSPTKA